MLTVREVARIFEVSEYTVRDWLKSDDETKIRGVKKGKSWRVHPREVARIAQYKYGE